MTVIIALTILVVLVAMAAFLAMAETALLAVSPIRVRRMVEEKEPRAVRLEKLLDDQNKFLVTILLLTLITQLSAATIASTLAYQYLKSVGAAIGTAVVTLIIFIYSEVAPKTYATQNAIRVALFVAGPIRALTALVYPVARALVAVANLSARAVGVQTSPKGPILTEEELKTAVSVVEEQGVIEEEEKKMIHHIFEFGDTVVREVMTPRPDMVVVGADVDPGQALELIMKEGHSRIPMYQDNIDNIVGVLYARDLLDVFRKGEKKRLKEMVRPALFVPETKRVSELLRELQQKKVHLAIVVDEYGSTVGLVTIEDLLEEIVGEIYDEYDLEEKMIEPVAEGRVRVDARLPIDDLNEVLGADVSTEDVDTVGGLVFELFGRVPEPGEETTFDNLKFRVEKVVGHRVLKVLITKLPKPA